MASTCILYRSGLVIRAVGPTGPTLVIGHGPALVCETTGEMASRPPGQDPGHQ